MVVGSVGEDPVTLPVGTRVELRDYLPPAVVWRTGRPARVDEDEWSNVSDPVADGLREAGNPVDGGEPDHRRRPPVGRGDRADDATAVSCRQPPTAWPTSPSWSRRRSGTRRAGPSWLPRGRGSSPPQMRPGGGSSGTCTTVPSSGWSRSAWSFASLRALVPAELPELEDGDRPGRGRAVRGVEDLREIARGIHPAILSEGGLGPALRTLARRAAIAVELDVAALGRLPEPVEVAAYYVVSEALTNATRHAHASVVRGGRGNLRRHAAGAGARRRCWRRRPATRLRPSRAEGPDRGARRHVLRAQPGGRRDDGVLRAPGIGRRHAVGCGPRGSSRWPRNGSGRFPGPRGIGLRSAL